MEIITLIILHLLEAKSLKLSLFWIIFSIVIRYKLETL